MTPQGLLFLLEQAELGKLWAVEFINAKTTWEDFKNFDMETIYRFSKVCDVDMIEFFTRDELLKGGYISKDEYRLAQFESMHAEVI
jgi:hypothetical protein